MLVLLLINCIIHFAFSDSISSCANERGGLPGVLRAVQNLGVFTFIQAVQGKLKALFPRHPDRAGDHQHVPTLLAGVPEEQHTAFKFVKADWPSRALWNSKMLKYKE